MFGGFNGNNGGNGGHHGHGHDHGHGHGHHGHHNNHNHGNEGFNGQVSSNQNWGQQNSWVPAQGAHYKLVSGLSNKMVMDVSQREADKNQLILYEWKNSSNQKFYFQSAGGNKWGIFSVQSNWTVEIPNASHVKGTRVVCGQPSMQANEMWELIPANFMGKPNSFFIKGCSGQVIDVYGAECKNEANITQWEHNGNNNQVWIIEQV